MHKPYHIINALQPAADAFAGTVATEVINLKNWGHVSFVILCGAGGTGTSTITVEACDNETPSKTVAIPFSYQEALSGNAFGPVIQAETAGFTTKPGAGKVYKVEVDAQSLANTGYPFVRLKAVEVVDDPVAGGIVAILTGGRYTQEVFSSGLS